MADSNIPIIGKKKKKKKNIKPTTNAFWKDIHTKLPNRPRQYPTTNKVYIPGLIPTPNKSLLPTPNRANLVPVTPGVTLMPPQVNMQPKFRPINPVIDLVDDNSPNITGQTGNTTINMPRIPKKISLNTTTNTSVKILANTSGEKKNQPQEIASIDMFSNTDSKLSDKNKNQPKELAKIDMFSNAKSNQTESTNERTSANAFVSLTGNVGKQNKKVLLATPKGKGSGSSNVRILADVAIIDEKNIQPGNMQSKETSMNKPQGSNVRILANIAIKPPDEIKKMGSMQDPSSSLVNAGKMQLNKNIMITSPNAPTTPGVSQNNPDNFNISTNIPEPTASSQTEFNKQPEVYTLTKSQVNYMYNTKIGPKATANQAYAARSKPGNKTGIPGSEECYGNISATEELPELEDTSTGQGITMSTPTATATSANPATQGYTKSTLNQTITSQAPTMPARSNAGSFFTTTPTPTLSTGGPGKLDIYSNAFLLTYKYPKGWDQSFKDLHLKAISSYQTWVASGKPRKGPSYNEMRECRKLFKNKKRWFNKSEGNVKRAVPVSVRKPTANKAGIPKSFLFQQKSAQESGTSQINAPDMPIWPMENPMNYQLNTPTLAQSMPDATVPAPIFVQTENPVDVQQQYSPSDIYTEQMNNPEPSEDQSSELSQGAQKRLSAFHRLGPVSQPKKPKLTINLTLNKEQPVREVVNNTDDDPDRYAPVHLRQNVIMSTDETVMKFLTFWPWRKNVVLRRSATARHSRSVMILEQEHMEEAYEKDNVFIQISVTGYPSSWTKERVLDAILESVKGHSLIPCFTEFTQHECKFLTLRTRSALIILHKTGFYIHKDGVELAITISQTDLTLNQIDFIPRIILRKRVAMGFENNKLNLSAFTLQDDISHFIYFPLNRVSNQTEFIQLQSVIPWQNLFELDLSHNRLTKLSGLDLITRTPKLSNLNLSHNYLDKITELIYFRGLPLKKICLEGNPLCHDYIDPEHYIKVIRMLFSSIVEIDGVPIHRKYELPQIKRNHCPDEARKVAEKYLEVYFPLLDAAADHRSLIQDMYEDDATLTITYCFKLRYGPIYRCFRNLFLYARFLDEGETDSVVGAMAITKLINRWPQTSHDPYSFTVDVMYHTETTTILRIGGVLKLTAETLAEDEHLLTFTRTVVLFSEEGDEYKIQNEMVYWDIPTSETTRSAFRINTIPHKKINLKIEATTDEDLREKYLQIFMKLTSMDKKISGRCLEMNSWNFKLALEHFTKLLKTHNLHTLYYTPAEVTAN